MNEKQEAALQRIVDAASALSTAGVSMAQASKTMAMAFGQVTSDVKGSDQGPYRTVPLDAPAPPTGATAVELDPEQMHALMRRNDSLYAQNTLIRESVFEMSTQLELASDHLQRAINVIQNLKTRLGKEGERAGEEG